MRVAAVVLAMATLAAQSPARAEVVDAKPNGFQVRETLEIKASPEAVWRVLVEPGLWWSSQHTFSGEAKNLTLDPRPGGCFCEAFPDGGGVRHSVVDVVKPGREL